MKPSSLFYLCMMLLTLPFMVACDDDDDNQPLSKTEMLAAKTWQGETVIAGGVDITDNEDLLKSLPDVRTLTLKFETDNTYEATYEQNGAEVNQSGNWEFRNNETILYFDLMSDYDLTIKTLNDQRLVLTTNVAVQGMTVPAEVHFRAL